MIPVPLAFLLSGGAETPRLLLEMLLVFGSAKLLAELGVMFLLFRVGLELKDFQLTKVGFDALMVAVLGVIVPFLGGWGLMAALGHPQIEAYQQAFPGKLHPNC